MSEHSTYTVIMETCTYHNISTISVWRLTGVMTLYLKIAMYVSNSEGGGGGGGGAAFLDTMYQVTFPISNKLVYHVVHVGTNYWSKIFVPS